ncbi:hypothetical protein KQI84_13360 [bacterium]|nr:hypothetical protein [bacterium]
MKRRVAIMIAVLLLGAWAAASHSRAGESETHFAIANGGVSTSAGGDFSLGGTAGQLIAGPAMTGGDFSQSGGFWHPVAGGLPHGSRTGWMMR